MGIDLAVRRGSSRLPQQMGLIESRTQTVIGSAAARDCLDGCLTALTVCWTFESHVEFLHRVIDEGDLVIGHEAVRQRTQIE